MNAKTPSGQDCYEEQRVNHARFRLGGLGVLAFIDRSEAFKPLQGVQNADSPLAKIPTNLAHFMLDERRVVG